MIMTYEPVILKAQDQFEPARHLIRQAGSEGRRIDQVEADLWGGCCRWDGTCLQAALRAISKGHGPDTGA